MSLVSRFSIAIASLVLFTGSAFAEETRVYGVDKYGYRNLNPTYIIKTDPYSDYSGPGMRLPLEQYKEASDDLQRIISSGLLTPKISMPYAANPSAALLQNFQKAGEDFAAAQEKQRKEKYERFRALVEIGDYEGARQLLRD